MIKKIILGFIILEIITIGIGYIDNGKYVFLPYTEFSAPALYYDLDSLYGVTRQKNTKQLISYPWGGIPYTTNAMGFRDDSYKPHGILVVGNSYVEGFGVKVENRFTEILEKQLDVSFNNAGSGGVWSAVQSYVIAEDFIKKHSELKKILVILTPGEILNIDTRTPKTDPLRNFPYKKNDSIVFYKATQKSFGQQLSFKDKIKRFSKSFFVSKLYTTFKYYGSAKIKTTEYEMNAENFEWLLNKFNLLTKKVDIDFIILNNLGCKKIKNIHSYENSHQNIYVIDFPDEYSHYFISNGHLNKKGNKVLAELINKKIPYLKN